MWIKKNNLNQLLSILSDSRKRHCEESQQNGNEVAIFEWIASSPATLRNDEQIFELQFLSLKLGIR